jgi:hypothetical protein
VNILDLSDIIRKENFIYYRREFSALAQYELPGKNHAGRVEFTIETAPTGKKEITVKLVDPVEYPLLPVVKTLKDFILNLDREGKLP